MHAMLRKVSYEYWSPKQIAESNRFPFSLAQIRHFLLHRHKNGLKYAVRKVGKGLIIRIDLFESWIENQQEGKNG